MRRKRCGGRSVCAAIILAAAMAGCYAPVAETGATTSPGNGTAPPAGVAQQRVRRPKNVIFFIGDGMGFNHAMAASLYRNGAPDMQAHEKFPVRLAVSTFSAGGSYRPDSAWISWEYLKKKPTDSAAAATALSSGVKTYNGAIGVGLDRLPVENIVERAEALGKATGVITSVEFSHATPAGFSAHVASRGDMSVIAKQMLYDSRIDVVMGAGHPDYDMAGLRADSSMYSYVGGREVWDAIVARHVFAGRDTVEDADGDGTPDVWTLIDSRDQFLRLGRGETPKRVLGVARVRTTLQQDRPGEAKAVPYAVDRIETVPTLVEMTRGALNVLDNDPDGFFLMVEGGAIDWAAHDNQFGRMIEEALDFGSAIDAAARWVEANSSWDETLIVVTADHETGYLWGTGSGPDPANPSRAIFIPPVNAGAGNVPGLAWGSGGHTNSLVPFYAKGVGSEIFRTAADETDLRRGPYLDNTEITRTLFSFWPKP